MDEYEHKLAARGLSAITCRPDAGQNSMVTAGRACTLFGTRTEARVANPPAGDAWLRDVKPDQRLYE